MAIAHVCDECGAVSPTSVTIAEAPRVDRVPLPGGWRFVSAWGDEDAGGRPPVGAVCSPSCAVSWLCRNYGPAGRVSPSDVMVEKLDPPRGLIPSFAAPGVRGWNVVPAVVRSPEDWPDEIIPGWRVHVQREGGMLPETHQHVVSRVIYTFGQRPPDRGPSGLRLRDGWPLDILLLAPTGTIGHMV